jgi:hypothetical protein
MKTYKDGVLEAAKLMLVRDVLSADGSVYRELIALAAQEDQRSEAERVGSPQPNSNTQSSDHPTTADDLLRECLDWGLPEDLKDRIDAHLSGKEKKA